MAGKTGKDKALANERFFYLDEAGDFTLFNKRGAVIVGSEGVSRTLMLGVAELPDGRAAAVALDSLRSGLLSDPYFKNVPSMDPTRGKTALYFHAKDDLPEVRREVIKLLPTFGAKIHVAIRRKEDLVLAARIVHSRGSRLTDGEIYDDLVKRLLKNLLHKAEHNTIVFARRGKADRRQSLEAAISRAKTNFNSTWRTEHDRPTNVVVGDPWDHAGLQVADYYLWALQRLFEKGEDRFFAALAPGYRLIMDLDDKRQRPYGEWYSATHPLTLEKIKPLVG